jgi:putative hydrolase of the HAD superfamily
MIKAVVFDFGGVLSRFGAVGDNGRRVARTLGCSEADMELKLRPLINRWLTGELNTTDFWRGAAERVHAAPYDYDAKWRAGEAVIFDPQYYDLATRLRAEGYRTAILSNIGPSSAAVVQRAGGWRGFNPVVLSCEVGAAKPNRKIYHRLLDELKLPGEAVLLVDDQPTNLAAAQQFGIRGLQAHEPVATIAQILAALSHSDAKRPA